MILIIDNIDSFVHNIARYVREAGRDVEVIRNDQISADECIALNPAGIILSPGPKAPQDAGICLELIKSMPVDMALLGVCLGHQCLVEAFGGATVRTEDPLHGEASVICHLGKGIFEGVTSPTLAGRYHSLIAVPATGGPFIETAWTEKGSLMGVSHKDYPWHGVQFHPESLLTPHGRTMIGNFLKICEGKVRS